MTPETFVYTELQISVPFDQAPWADINTAIKAQPGFLSKTWLSGYGTNSLGGFYAFKTETDARAFVTGYFPGEAAAFGAPQLTRLFDACIVEDASRDLASPHFGGRPASPPGAYVYTEVQVSKSFATFPWQDRNTALKQVPGLLAKTWLSGIGTETLGGFDVFDTLDNAKQFALETFPKTAAALDTAFTTRIFEAPVTEAASRDMGSPYYA
ncbi:MAG: YdhR family protein [Rhodospirillales bacterium]|nr:YdhR family protein [Rhodospirillales bacterium]MBO6788016.1 YdhR family protein [Rhodospirillales bacterium]